MNISFIATKAQLKVFSAICSNFTVVWIAALFATQNIATLTTNIILVIVSWKLAVKAEDLLEEL